MNLKKKRAATVLAGWLEAAEVPFKINGDSIIIGGKDGDFGPDAEALADLAAPLDKAMPAFWVLTERAGYGRPVVVDRGSAPDGVRYNDDPELVAMRHREFRQVANLPDHVYKDQNYHRIINWYCNKFFRSNYRLCQHAGYEVEDVKTYAWLYLTNFYGRWRHLDRKAFDAKSYSNGKMFCSYLQQRLYSDLKPLLIRKSRNIVIDAETAELGTGIGFSPQFEDGEEHSIQVATASAPEIDIEAYLDDLSHDEAVTKLQAAAEVGITGAQRKLVEHRADCIDCSEYVGCDFSDAS